VILEGALTLLFYFLKPQILVQGNRSVPNHTFVTTWLAILSGAATPLGLTVNQYGLE
jgi:hypothetical protein